MIVADTNLIVYLYIKGQRTNQAEAVVLKDPEWAVPLLWRSEFRNTLMGLVRNHDLVLGQAIAIIEEAEQWMTGREYAVVSHRVLNLAAQSECSAYNSEFVSLAEDLGVTLVTVDRQILRAFPDTSISPENFLA
ncbi:MAG: type II toxin-antitoxin system VapC family toxin [Nitrospirales bacterium]|nr:type II toxin-antitoxin system VapC family toxin [Nitrospira sp.]MDR4502142.1 type II toxin-antitoxin system VapC family toxin [Nitrospirales bacterium]